MAAYGEFFSDRARAEAAMERLRGLYQRRLDYVIPRLKGAGLEEACRTDAGFFTQWKVPRRVLGIRLVRDPRTKGMPLPEAFNRLVAGETGIVGVHFSGPRVDGRAEPLVRYAVCADVLDRAFRSRFEEQLARLEPDY